MTVNINEHSCVGCGLCAEDCPCGHIYIKDGKAAVRQGGCIKCGHCYAVCPTHAVSIPGLDEPDGEGLVPMDELCGERLLGAMKLRRSVRKFKDIPVEREKLEMIIQAGRYCPTAKNSQRVAYTVLGGRQREIEGDCVRFFKGLKKSSGRLGRRITSSQIDDSFFFKGAPLVIVVSSPYSVDAALASSYMELMAASLGLGVMYSGFFVVCARAVPKIRKKLGLLKGYKVHTCLVIGYPDVKYLRSVPRKEPKVNIL